MATAVQPSTAANEASPRARLATASLAGAGFVVLGVLAAVYALPALWRQSVSPAVVEAVGPTADAALSLLAEIAVVAGIVTAGTALAGANPPKGVRGGIFLVISTLMAGFFFARAAWINLDGSGARIPVTLAVIGGALFGTFRLATSRAAQGWMEALEEQGWFHTFNYKRTQGIKARRYTLLGFLLLGWTGVYTLAQPGVLDAGDLRATVPFFEKPVTILPAAQYSLPLLLAVGAFWVSWRAVNMPVFADFLIATEAEMNKVSWPTRKGLVQDTVVVLVTTVLLTGFLLFVDLFWGWLLSQSWIGVLPAKDATPATQLDPNGGKKLGW